MKKPYYLPALFLMLTSCTTYQTNYGIVGDCAVSNDNKYIAVVVAENKGTTYQENGGFRKTNYKTTCWLKLYETGSGRFLKKEELGNDPNHTGIDCYGVYNNTIWIYANGIRAFDISNLKEITNEEKIAKANNIKTTVFPYGDRLINAAVETGYIDFTANNGEEYRLTLDNLKISNKEEIKEKENQEKNIQRLLKEDDYGVRCDTFENRVYIFAKDSGTAAVTSLSDHSLSEVAYRMKLFTTNYTIRTPGSHNSFTYENIKQVTQGTFLNPCFAKDTYTDAVIHLSNPGGYLIIHQDVPGEKSKAIITRIDTDGKKIWETAPGVSTKISNYIKSGKYCVFSTNKDYMFSPHIGSDALCIVDIETGKIIKVSLDQ